MNRKITTKMIIVVSTVIFILVLTDIASASGSKDNSTQGNNSSTVSTQPAKGQDSDGDGIPDSAEPTLGTDPANPDTDGDGIGDLTDPNPLFLKNPIQEDSSTNGIKIDDIRVENNVNAAGKNTSDHLELKVTNISTVSLSDFEVYYSIKDLKTGEIQAYYRTLPNFSLKPGETKKLHFDNSGEPGHYSINPNSMYFTSQNKRELVVSLHPKNFSILNIKVNKDAGGTETAD